jgi:adenosylcobyric acid synthase
MDDLKWLRQCGLEASILKHASYGKPVVGICGGYQMMGNHLADPDGVEAGGEMRGMGLLDSETIFMGGKTRTRVNGIITGAAGTFEPLKGTPFTGYEIHMGKTTSQLGALAKLQDGENEKNDGLFSGNVWGSYVHGIFDKAEFSKAFVNCLLRAKGLDENASSTDWDEYKEQQYELLAENVRKSLDMEYIYKVLNKQA